MTGDIIRCMVAIYGQKSDGWIYDWRQALLSAGIPCALVGPPFGFAALADRLIFVLFSSKNDASSIAFQKSLPLEKTLDISPDTSPEALVDFVKLRFFQNLNMISNTQKGTVFVLQRNARTLAGMNCI